MLRSLDLTNLATICDRLSLINKVFSDPTFLMGSIYERTGANAMRIYYPIHGNNNCIAIINCFVTDENGVFPSNVGVRSLRCVNGLRGAYPLYEILPNPIPKEQREDNTSDYVMVVPTKFPEAYINRVLVGYEYYDKETIFRLGGITPFCPMVPYVYEDKFGFKKNRK